MKLDRLLYIFLVLGVFLVVYKGSVYVIGENEQVVITRFGKIIKVHKDAGTHFKIPGIHQTHYFPKDAYRTESAYQVQTIDNRPLSLTVQFFWKITDPALFLSRVRDKAVAEARVEDEIKPAIKAALGSFRLDELGGDRNTASFDNLKRKTDIERDVLKFAQPKLQAIGIELVRIE